MDTIFYFSALLLVQFFLTKYLEINFFPIFFIININVIVDMVFGGFITKLAIGDFFVQPNVDFFILSTIFFPSFVYLFFYPIFQHKYLDDGINAKRDISNFEIWLSKTFKLSKIVFLITSTIIIISILKSGFLFRDFYRYIIEMNLGFVFLLAYTSGLCLIFKYLLDKKYLRAIIILIFISVLGKKHPVVYAILIPFLYNLFTSNKIKLIHFIIPIFLVFFFSFYAIFLTDALEITVLEQLQSSFDYYLNFNYFVKNYKLGIDEGRIFFTSFYKWIPRFIWTDKPNVYGFLLIHEKIFFKEMLENYFPSVFEEYAEPLADFGWYVAWFIICLKKFFLIFIFFLKKIKFKHKMILTVLFFDSFLGLYIVFSSFVVNNSFLNKSFKLVNSSSKI